MDDGGMSLTIGASAVSAITGAVIAWYKTRQTVKTSSEIKPQPLPVVAAPRYVTTETYSSDIKRNLDDHGNIFLRLANLEQRSAELLGKLNLISDDVRDVKNILMRRERDATK